MGESIVYVVGFILFGFLVIVPVVATLSSGGKKKQSVKDEEFRSHFDDMTETHRMIVENQEKIMTELTEINKRITTIEKILKEVE